MSPRLEGLRGLPHGIQNKHHGLQPIFGTESYGISFGPSKKSLRQLPAAHNGLVFSRQSERKGKKLLLGSPRGGQGSVRNKKL